MIYFVILFCILATSCSVRSTYPTLGGVIGGSAGSIAGGPVVGGLSAGAGVLAGEAWKNKDALIEAEETIEALSHGEISALVSAGLQEHKSGFDKFTSTIKQWLIFAAVALGAYLVIPIFIAKKTAQSCSRNEAKKAQTRYPFVTPPPRK